MAVALASGLRGLPKTGYKRPSGGQTARALRITGQTGNLPWGGKEMDVEDKDLIRVLSEAYSAGTEAFRDALLIRCLDVLEEDERCEELGDEDLDMLAAAGNPTSPLPEEWTPARRR